MNTVDSQQSERKQQGWPLWVVGAAIVVSTMVVVVAFIFGGDYLSRIMHKQPIVQITVDCPGLGAVEIDSIIAHRLAWKYWISEGVQEAEAISTVGRVDIYLTGRPGTNAEEMLNSIRAITMTAVEDLPAGIQQPVTVLLPDDATIPTVQIQQIDTAVAKVDLGQIMALGISVQEITKAVSNATDTGDNLDSAAPLTIGDQTIPLSEVATIVQEKKPSHVVTSYP